MPPFTATSLLLTISGMNASRKKIGPAPGGIILSPLEPFAWRRAAQNEPGPACLCLRLLPMAAPLWQHGGGKISPQDIPHLPAALAGQMADELCAPWLTTSEQAELENLETYLKALADYPGLSCAQCREQEKNGEDPPDCGACPLPRPPEMADVLWEAARLLKHLPGQAAAQALGDMSPRELRLIGHGLEIIDRLSGAKRRGRANIK